MTDVEIRFTREWWYRKCSDPRNMEAWLQKLQSTEQQGSRDYYKAIAQYGAQLTHQQQALMIHIATDEARHAQMIRSVLRARGITPMSKSEAPESQYWSEMGKHMVCVRTFAAANYFGELLAAERFCTILSHHQTPPDVFDLIRAILPDEDAHHKILFRMAGEAAINEMRKHHLAAVETLKGK